MEYYVFIPLLLQFVWIATRDHVAGRPIRSVTPCREVLQSALELLDSTYKEFTLSELYSVSGRGLIKFTESTTRPLTVVDWPWNSMGRSYRRDSRLILDKMEATAASHNTLINLITIRSLKRSPGGTRYLAIKALEDGNVTLVSQERLYNNDINAYWKWRQVGNDYGTGSLHANITTANGTTSYFLGVRRNGTVFLHEGEPHRYALDSRFVFHWCVFKKTKSGPYVYSTCWLAGTPGLDEMLDMAVERCLQNERSG